ncbi:helix-turn-helix transcriptional regulator [Patulibacter sp. S7RM1-6]
MTSTEAIRGVAPPPSRHAELGEFLRLHRERTTPESVGIVPEGRRRTPGLRREEVSGLAGVGLSWYTWLEQGRDVTPSAGVLDALARVLGLTTAERAHLFHLAGVPVPTDAGPYPQEAPPDLAAIVDGLAPAPAYLLGPRLDVLAWNAAASLLMGTPTAAPDGRRNMLWWMLTADDRGELWRTTVRHTLARFRTEHARRHGDPAFDALVAALHEESPRFRELWPRHEVLADQLGTKHIDHPELGALEVFHLQSIPTSHPDLRMTQFVPADAATRRAFAQMGDELGLGGAAV